MGTFEARVGGERFCSDKGPHLHEIWNGSGRDQDEEFGKRIHLSMPLSSRWLKYLSVSLVVQ